MHSADKLAEMRTKFHVIEAKLIMSVWCFTVHCYHSLKMWNCHFTVTMSKLKNPRENMRIVTEPGVAGGCEQGRDCVQALFLFGKKRGSIFGIIVLQHDGAWCRLTNSGPASDNLEVSTRLLRSLRSLVFTACCWSFWINRQTRLHISSLFYRSGDYCVYCYNFSFFRLCFLV